MANPDYSNSITGAAYLLGLTAEELTECLWIASQHKEIRTQSGQPFMLPHRPRKEDKAPKVYNIDPKGSGRHTGLPKERNH